MANYSKFQPVLRDGLPDWKDGDDRWEGWLAEQVHYIQNGYTAGGDTITGRYYFHLNFATVEGVDERGYRVEQTPYDVDVMRDLFNLVDYSIPRNEDVFVWKARDKAYSYNMVSIAVKEMMFEKNNTLACAFPKGEEVRYKENFRLKYDATWNNLPQCMKQYADLVNTKDMLQYGWQEKDEETGQMVKKGSKNTISFVKVSNKDILKSFRTKFIIVDEAGEIDCLKAFRDTNTANMMYGSQKFGTMIMGGTSNALHDGYKDVCFLWDHAKDLGINKFFIPRYKALWGWTPYYKSGNIYVKGEEPIGKRLAIDPETGTSLVDIAEEHFERKLDQFVKTNDKEGELEFRQNYPKDEADAFLRSMSSPYPVMDLEQQKRFVETNEQILSSIDRGNIVIKYNQGIRTAEWVSDVNGRWKRYLQPDKNLVFKDCIGVDTVRDEEAPESDSKNAIVVYRPFQKMGVLGALPVCIYHYRHASLYTFFEDLLATAIYYDAPFLFEYLNQMLPDYMIENGGVQYMSQRPSLLTELGSKAQNRYGVKPQSGYGPSLSYSVEETKGNVDNHVFSELINELCKFGTANTDLESAYRWAILLSKEHVRVKKVIDERERRLAKPKKFERYCTKVDGKVVVVMNEQHQQQLQRGIR